MQLPGSRLDRRHKVGRLDCQHIAVALVEDTFGCIAQKPFLDAAAANRSDYQKIRFSFVRQGHYFVGRRAPQQVFRRCRAAREGRCQKLIKLLLHLVFN